MCFVCMHECVWALCMCMRACAYAWNSSTCADGHVCMHVLQHTRQIVYAIHDPGSNTLWALLSPVFLHHTVPPLYAATILPLLPIWAQFQCTVIAVLLCEYLYSTVYTHHAIVQIARGTRHHWRSWKWKSAWWGYWMACIGQALLPHCSDTDHAPTEGAAPFVFWLAIHTYVPVWHVCVWLWVYCACVCLQLSAYCHLMLPVVQSRYRLLWL